MSEQPMEDAAPIQPTSTLHDYSSWSKESLIQRIAELERQLNTNPSTSPSAQTVPAHPPPPPPPPAPVSAPVPTQTVSQQLEQPKQQQQQLQNKQDPPPDDFTRVPAPTRGKKKAPREMDPSKYNTRFIALKFAYLGQRYNGYEHANGNPTPLPTIEEELWKALRRARLIFPKSTLTNNEDDGGDKTSDGLRPYTIDWEGCDYSKCGRTDRGVSAFGQVIGIRVRSAQPKDKPKPKPDQQKVESAAGKKRRLSDTEDTETAAASAATEQKNQEQSKSNPDDDWDDIADELPYIQILNNLLPEDIRVLAWCPNPPPGFDARFSCRERRYKYFFTQPAFSPVPNDCGFMTGSDRLPRDPSKRLREGWLDIDAMREAASYFVGRHDFRNFCKLDTSKQINNFERVITRATIDLVDPRTNPLSYVGNPEFQPRQEVRSLQPGETTSQEEKTPATPLVYCFTLHGSAFLWHQVRHMVAILFLIGQGLESPTLVKELLDVKKNPCKPTYEMASDTPLVLWDCIFPDEKSGSNEDALDWVYCGDPRLTKKGSNRPEGKYTVNGLVDGLWSVWRQRKMDEILAGSLLDLVVSQAAPNLTPESIPKKQLRSQRLFLGGNEAKPAGSYVPVLQKPKLEPVEVQNAKYLASQKRKAEKGVQGGGDD